MRVGLFIGGIEDKKQVLSLREKFNDEIVGYSSPAPIPSILDDIKFQPYPLELLSGCDVAMIFDKKGIFESISKSAIKRGIHVYIHYLNHSNVSQLIELKGLLQEINVSVGFGFSGQNLSDYIGNDSLLNTPFFMDYRVMLSQFPNNSSFKDQLLCDIATIVRLKIGQYRKIRFSAFPSSSANYNLMNLRIEFPNGSLINYTLSRLEPINRTLIYLYGNQIDMPLSFEFDKSSLFHSDKLEVKTPVSFVDSIKNSTDFGFSVDEAIAVQQISCELESKLIVH
jgi:hypothetical protein